MSTPTLEYQPPPRRPAPIAGGIPLFNLFGIQVYLHWSWFIIAMIQIQNPINKYSSIGWNIAEYISLFGIVLMHEFGHALACRSVGGEANRIMLWPLGGVAFVSPPQRPGAVLWSIAAGPLVNVLLVPVTFGVAVACGTWTAFSNQLPMSDVQEFVYALTSINVLLLLFNMLPIYPLDGGQILQALLWFFIGQARSLMVASIIGLIGAGLGALLAISTGDIWLIVIAGFAAMQSWIGFQRSRILRSQEEPPLRYNVRCPGCSNPPPVGPYWMCSCGRPFDVFEHQGRCPNCSGVFMSVPCPTCSKQSPPYAWLPQVATAPNS